MHPKSCRHRHTHTHEINILHLASQSLDSNLVENQWSELNRAVQTCKTKIEKYKGMKEIEMFCADEGPVLSPALGRLQEVDQCCYSLLGRPDINCGCADGLIETMF